MRRVLLAVLILILPTATAVVVYLIVNKKIPTNREAIGRAITLAGAGHPGVEDGQALAATFSDPFGVAVDKRGNVLVADSGDKNRIRRINTLGKVETVAGSTEGFGDGDALRAQFNTPSGIAIDNAGNIIIADTSNNRIRKLSADGRLVSTIAGSGAVGYRDGPAYEAEFDGPVGVAVDPRGNVFIADTYNDRIRKFSADGLVTTVAGTGLPGFTDGNASVATFNTPSGVCVDEKGNVFVADTENSALRKITPQGDVSTIATTAVRLRHPVGIVVTHDGFLFVTASSRVMRISPDGEAVEYAGGEAGFRDASGNQTRFNGLSGIAIDREGKLYVADTQNYLIREIDPTTLYPRDAASTDEGRSIFIQPSGEAVASNIDALIPSLDPSHLNIRSTFPWPLEPQNRPHEITGVVGEARGAPGGIALDHLHSGLDIRGSQGEPVLAVMDEKVSSPVAAWDFGGAGEGIQIGVMSYIHTRVGRNVSDEVQTPERFKPTADSSGKIVEMRVRRGTRFKVGDFVGTVNRLYHVHLNVGPWNAQANPLTLPFVGLKDTTPPTVEPDGIEVVDLNGTALTQKQQGRLLISGDVRILVNAYDRADGNGANRKLGLYRVGYQVIAEDGGPVKGFEQPLINIEFKRLPPEDSSVVRVYAEGSGVSAYGTPTKFKYIVTNRVRDGEAIDGVFRTSLLAPGNYIIRVIAEDYAGNQASGKSTELVVTLKN